MAKNKELTKYSPITQFLDYITEPNKLEQRSERYREIVQTYPFVRSALSEAFYPSFEYEKVIPFFQAKEVSRMKYFGDTTFAEYWKKHYRYDDSFEGMSPKKKYTQMIQNFYFMDESDVNFIMGLVHGEYRGPDKINPLFLKAVDPELSLGKSFALV
jgi:hypothetical protein